MKKSLALATAVALAWGSASAAPVTVNGTIGSWKGWNAASKSPIPFFASLAGGINLNQGNNSGDAVGTGSITLNVTGTLDSVTGYGTLTQVGSFTGWFDSDSDLLVDDSATISGLAWTLDATGLHQTAGSATGCTSSAPGCSFTVSGTNSNDHSNGLGQSIFDFQGIAAGFQTRPQMNAGGTGYGTASFLTWAGTAGAAGSWSGLTYTSALAVEINSGSAGTNSANKATLSVTAVPVPAAVWLFGSALGLLGLTRRRSAV